MMGTPQTVTLLLSVNPLLAAGLVVLFIVVAWLFRRETASGSDLARRLQLTHYPVLITDGGLTQEPAP